MTRTALVTGGNRGIGKAIVKALRADGVRVAVTSSKQTDLTQAHDRHGLIKDVADMLGGLDILVNNAGAQVQQPILTYEMTAWREQLELLLTAPFDLSQQAAKYMKIHGGGHIVNILSTAAFQGARNIAGYVAAKHGLLGLTRAMAIELAPDIHVNAVAPGLIDTDLTGNIESERRELLSSITPAGRFGKPKEVADAVMYLVNSTFVFGQTIIVDGGWMAKNG